MAVKGSFEAYVTWRERQEARGLRTNTAEARRRFPGAKVSDLVQWAWRYQLGEET